MTTFEVIKKNIPNFIDDNPEDIFDLIAPLREVYNCMYYKALDKRDGELVTIKILELNGKYKYQDLKQQCECLKLFNSFYTQHNKANFFWDNILWIVMDFCNVISVLNIFKVRKTNLTEIQIQIIIKQCL